MTRDLAVVSSSFIFIFPDAGEKISDRLFRCFKLDIGESFLCITTRIEMILAYSIAEFNINKLIVIFYI